MKTISIQFKNRPNSDGTLSNLTIEECLVYSNGSPTAKRPQIGIHLPEKDDRAVVGAWVDYEGSTYHVVGMSAPGIKENVPGRWNRYCIAEKVY